MIVWLKIIKSLVLVGCVFMVFWKNVLNIFEIFTLSTTPNIFESVGLWVCLDAPKRRTRTFVPNCWCRKCSLCRVDCGFLWGTHEQSQSSSPWPNLYLFYVYVNCHWKEKLFRMLFFESLKKTHFRILAS